MGLGPTEIPLNFESYGLIWPFLGTFGGTFMPNFQINFKQICHYGNKLALDTQRKWVQSQVHSADT